MYANQSMNEIKVKKKITQKLGMKILLAEKMKKNPKIVSSYIPEHYTSFGTKNSIWTLLKEGQYVNL